MGLPNTIYTTGRQRTVTWTGTVTASQGSTDPSQLHFQEYSAFYSIYAAVPGVANNYTLPTSSNRDSSQSPYVLGTPIPGTVGFSGQLRLIGDHTLSAPSGNIDVYQIQIGTGFGSHLTIYASVPENSSTLLPVYPYIANIGGTFTISLDLEECFYFTHAPNDPAGALGQWNRCYFFERVRAGGTVSVTYAGQTVSDTLTTASAQEFGYLFYGNVQGWVQNTTQTFSITPTWNDTTGATALGVPWTGSYGYSFQPDPYSLETGTVTASTTGGVSLTIADNGEAGRNQVARTWSESCGLIMAPGQSVTYDGRVKTLNQSYSQAPVSLFFNYPFGTPAQITGQSTDATGNYPPTTFQESNYSVLVANPNAGGAGWSTTPPATVVTWGDAAVQVQPGADHFNAFPASDYAVAWLHGKSFTTLTASLPAKSVIDSCSSLSNWTAGPNTTLSIVGGKVQAVVSGGPGSITVGCAGSPYPQGWAYRTFQWTVQSTVNSNAPFSISVPTYLPPGFLPNPGTPIATPKVWNGTTGTAGAATAVKFDGCSPASPASLTLPGTGPIYYDAGQSRWWRYPGTAQTDALPASWMWGIGPITSMQITGLADGETYTFSEIAFVRSACDLSVSYGDGNPRGIWLDGRCDNKHFSLETNVSDGTSGGGGTLHGMATGLAVDTAWSISEATSFPDGFHDNTLPAEFFAGRGWIHNGSSWTAFVKQSAASPLAVPAQTTFRYAHFYPGIGDPFFGGGYSTSAAFPARFHLEIRSLASGLVFAPGGAPAVSDTVQAADPNTASTYGSGTTGSDGYYETGAPAVALSCSSPRITDTTVQYGVTVPTSLFPGSGWVRVCLRPPRPQRSGTLSPWNHHHPWGQYHRAYTDQGNIYYNRSDFAIPDYRSVPAWAVDSLQLTSSGQDSEPRMIVDQDRKTRLVFTRSYTSPAPGQDVWEQESWDDASTWTNLSTIFPGGKHGLIARGHLDGTVIRAAYSSATGTITATYQESGQNPSAPYSLLNGSGTPLSVDDSPFCIAQDYSSQRLWWLSALSGGIPSLYTSSDGLAWTYQGSYLSAQRPIIACAPDGGMIHAGTVTTGSGPTQQTTIQAVYQEAGTNWSLPYTLTDDTGANLLVADDGFMLSSGPDPARPWVLTALPAGGSDVQEWTSSDGQSFTLVA